MATDTTNFTPDMNSNSADNEPNFDAVQLAQATPAGAPVQVVIPAGANVVRIPVTAGETIELPFGADAHLLGKLGDNGNLAIKVGDVTVILEGYTAAEGQQPVIIETADGKPLDVATVLAQTDPGLDIQTAAGGAEGAQGADNTGAIFAAFGPGAGLGGFGSEGALGATELQYKLIDAEAKFFLVGQEEADTHPTPTNTEGQVDENGKRHLCENPFDDCYGGIKTDPDQPGDDEWAACATFKVVDYGPDGPAAVDALVGNIGDGHCYDKNGDQVYSHGEEVLLKAGPDGELIGYVKSDCCQESEIPLEFAKLSKDEIQYNSEEGCYERIVFTATPVDGGATGEITFKLLGPLDHPFNTDPDAEKPVDVLTLADAETGDGTSGDGDGCCDPYAKWHEFEDNIILDLHFDAKDGDDVTATDIPVAVNVDDDSPAFLDCNFDPCQGYTIIADETHGVQCGTDDVDVTFCFLEAIAGQQVEPGESTIFDKFVCFFGYDAVQNLDICDITAAQKHLKFGYGADGPLVHEICYDGSEGNPETAPALQSQGFGYGENGDGIINCGALLTNSCGDVWFCEETKLTITVGDCDNTRTLCVKMEGFGNTIFGYAEDYNNQPSFDGGEGGGSCKIPVFIITIDPDTKELTYVQLHQINNDNPWDPNEANDGGEGSCHVLEQINIGLAVTDYDHDSIWTPVHITVLDDGPKLECVTYNCVETVYENDFSSDDLKGATTSDGYGSGSDAAIITGGQLILTDESLSDSQWLKVDGGSEFHGSFHAAFDVILNDNGENGSADGFSFQVGNDVNTDVSAGGAGAEEPNTTGFALTFDTYDNGGGDVPNEIAVWFNGAKLDSRADLGDLNSLSPLNVVVDVQGSHYSVSIGGTEYFSGNLGGTIPSDADFYFGARTGGEADTQGIDNICITAPCDEAHVDEDFLKYGNHDNDGGPGAHGDDQGSVCATGQVNVDFGRDQPGSFCLDKLTITDDKGCVIFDHCTNNLFTSKGEPISVEFCGDKVIGIACGQPAFILTIDCNGCFKFELFQALEHPFHDSDLQNNGPDKNFEDNLHFDFGVKATDADGDSVCTEIKVSVDDDAPTICGVCYISENTEPQQTDTALVSRGGQIISCEFGSVDEDWLPKGNHDYDTNPDNLNNPFGDGNNGDGPGGLCVTGHINGKVGADQPGTYSFNIPGLCEGHDVPTCLTTSNGDHPISLHLCQEGCNWVVTGVYCGDNGEAEAFRVTLDSKTGEFKFELETALQHPDSNGNPGDNAWDDGFARYEDDICLNFGVKLTDSDGDSACTTLTFKVDDDAPVICDVVYHNQETGQPQETLIAIDGGEGHRGSSIGQVDEDWLSNGNHDTDTNPDNLNNPFGDGNNGDGPGGTCVFGQINAKIGADQPGSFLFNIPGLCESGDTVLSCYKTSEGYPITLTLCQEGCNWVVKGTYVDGTVDGDPTEEAFRITLDSKTGCFKFELETALQHPDTNGDHSDDPTDDGKSRYEDDLLVKFDVKVVDSDGDAAKTCLVFKVDDDAPTLDGTSCYTTNLLVNGSFEDPQQGSGAWTTYHSIPGWFADGEASNGPIEIQNNTVVTAADGNQYLELDSNNYANNNAHVAQWVSLPAGDEDGTFLLTFSFTPRTGDPATNEGEVWWNGAKVADIDGTGTPGVWQTISILVHGDASNVQNGRLEFRGADNDGNDASSDSLGGFIDNVSLKCVVSVDEDASLDPNNRAPGIEGGPGDDGTVGHCATGNLGVKFGADGPGGISFDPSCQPAGLTSHGEEVLYKSDGAGGLIAYIANGPTGEETIFTLTINNDGDFKFDLVRPLDHPDTNNDHSDDVGDLEDNGRSSFEDNLLFDLKFTAVDADGDAIKGSLTINVDDDSPTASCSQAPCIVECNGNDEDDHFNVDVSQIIVTDHNGDPASLIVNGNGFGVGSDSDGGDGGRFDEINYVGDGATGFPTDSEHLFADFGGQVAESADVDLSVFFGGEGAVGNEQGAYRLYLDGVAGEWHIFTANSGTGNFNFHINPDAGTQGFDKIEFVAIPGSVDPDGNDAGDSSDYSIKNIAVDLKACAQVEGCVTWGFGADGPGSVALVHPPKDFVLFAHGEQVGFVLSDDGTTLTGVTGSGEGETKIFELILDPTTGKYHFYLYEPLDHVVGEQPVDELNLPFQFKVTDFDGDAVLGDIKICVQDTTPPDIHIVPGNDRPHLEDGTLLVDEDGGLPGSIPGDVANGDNNGVIHTSGQAVFGFGVDGPGSFGLDSAKVSEGGASGLLDHDGNSIQYHVDALSTPGHEIVTGFVDSGPVGFDVGDKQFFKLDLNDADGKFTFDLLNAVKHPSNSDEDNVGLNIGVKVTDFDGDSKTADIKIDIDDDAPVAIDDHITVKLGGQATIDVQFIIDVSGSMGGNVDNVPGFADTRLGLARYSMQQLILGHPEIQNIQFIKFDNGASHSVWLNRADALTYIGTDGNFGGGGTTNYDIALTESMSAFGSSARPEGVSDQTVVYFLSDGAPNTPGGADAGITSLATDPNVSTGEWETFVTTPANDISHVFAVALGSGASIDNLEPIAFPNTDTTPADGNEDAVIVIPDANLSALTGALDDLLSGIAGEVTGNVTIDVTPDLPGADGYGAAKLVSVTFDTDGSGAGIGTTTLNFSSVVHVQTINMGADRGTLEIHDDGTYKYTPPSGGSIDYNPFYVEYTIQDADGDKSTAKILIDIQAAPVANTDHIYTNISGAFSVADSLLIKNDSDADNLNSQLAITGVIAAAGQATFFDVPTPSHAGTDVTINLDIGGGANAIGDGETTSFDYTLADPDSNTATGNVLVTYDTSGSIDGSGGNDILIGKDAGLHGGHGDDHMIGTGSHDLLDYSDVGGTWSLDLASGTATVDGNDTFAGIDDASGGSGNNTINGDGNNNILNGNNGNDTLNGNGGNDTLNGGDGNDNLNGGSGTDNLNGGSGDDRLVYDGTDILDGGSSNSTDLAGTRGDIMDISGAGNVNLTLAHPTISGIETIDMTGGGNTTLTLNANDVINLGSGHFDSDGLGIPDLDAVKVDGNVGDQINLSGGGWFDITTPINNEPAGYHVFAHDTNGAAGLQAGNVNAYLIVDNDVTVTGATIL